MGAAALQATLRVREMLLSRNPRHQAWACAYLYLAPHGQGLLTCQGMWQWMVNNGFAEWAVEVLADEST